MSGCAYKIMLAWTYTVHTEHAVLKKLVHLIEGSNA